MVMTGPQRARFVAQWYLGDPGWADIILGAYENEDDYWYQQAYEESESDNDA